MTARDELTLLRAVDSQRDGAWLCHVREQIPATSALRVHVGLNALVKEGLIRCESGAYGMSVFKLTLNGHYRLRRPKPRSYARAA